MSDKVRILSNGESEVTDKYNYTIQQSKINLLWNEGIYGDEIKIGIVDTGIDENHDMLKGKIICGKNFSSDGTPSTDINDYNYHGTAVASLAGGRYMNYKAYGVAPNAQFIIAKSLDASGNGSLTALTNGINYCIDNGADIINCSVGSADTSDALEEAIDRAIRNNISIVCAMGNDAEGDYGTVRELAYPAGYGEPICVGAMDVNYGMGDFSNSNEYCDVLAQGVDMLCAYPNNQYAIISGTSFACPIISGILALLKQKFKIEWKRNPSESELFGQLMKYTRYIEGINKECQGNGYIDLSIRRRKIIK